MVRLKCPTAAIPVTINTAPAVLANFCWFGQITIRVLKISVDILDLKIALLFDLLASSVFLWEEIDSTTAPEQAPLGAENRQSIYYARLVCYGKVLFRRAVAIFPLIVSAVLLAVLLFVFIFKFEPFSFFFLLHRFKQSSCILSSYIALFGDLG